MHLLVWAESNAGAPTHLIRQASLSIPNAELGTRTQFVKTLSDEATEQTEDVEEGEGRGDHKGNYP